MAALVAMLPFAALARGIYLAVRDGDGANHSAGVFLSLLALLLGSLFFLYSVRYYLATLLMLTSSLVLSTTDGNGTGHASGGGRAHGLMRFVRRRNGNGNGHGNGNGNGNGNGHFDLGREPFVSIHIATYNEKRVIGRLLEACAALEYGNFEVVVVDDSIDETKSIIDAWRSRTRFKVIHRPKRDGFKGGALEMALLHTDPSAEFVIVWDADVLPFPDSIQTFLPHFYRTDGSGQNAGVHVPRLEVAAVQSYQWHVLNRSESWLTEAVRAEYAGSYMIERPFQEFIGSLKMIAGTTYMIRAGLLREVGWSRSLTEDWELTLRLHALGYKVVYTPYAESPSECVGTFGRLARQRMRWAEGHSYNVRRWFSGILRSPHVTRTEKVEFLYYSTYYLQAAFFVVGSAAWLVSELVLRAHVPEWFSVFGWSLLITNMLSLPVMNLAGLLLEGAPPKDLVGVLGALLTSFLLVPFQTYAALKGLVERQEGPWYRTPKTGRVTDPVQHLRRLKWLRRWLARPRPSARERIRVRASVAPRPRANGLGWIVVGGLAIALLALAIGAFNAPTARAAGSTLFLHGTATFTLDATAPAGLVPATLLLAPVGATRTWATTTSTSASQTIASTTAFTFQYWTTGVASGMTGATIALSFSAASNCSSATTIAQSSVTLAVGSGLSSPSFSPTTDVTVPAGSFFCFTLTVTAVGVVNLTLDSDAASTPTNLTSTQTIFIPEFLLPLVGLAVIAPVVARRGRRRWGMRP